MITTEVVTDIERLAALEPAWWNLWRRCPAATPFQSPAWLIAWWRAFAPGRLCTSAAFEGARLVGLFPFYVEDTATGGRLLPVGISVSDYLDVLLDPACPAAAEALVRQTLGSGWQSWEFEQLSPEAAAHGLACPADLGETLAEQDACPVLVLAGGDDLVGCVPTRRRRQLRRARAAAAAQGTVEIVRAERTPDAFLDVLFALHEARWRSRGEPGLQSDARVQQFHRAALPGLASAGLARCHELRIGARTVGAYYGLLHRGQAFAYMGGFDPDDEAVSPGAILIGHAIEEAIREGADEFHFLRGREAYKYTWGAKDRWNRRRAFTRVPAHA